MYETDLANSFDLSVPNSLAVNKDNTFSLKSIERGYKEAPKFQVGEQLVFMDPASGLEAYGRYSYNYHIRRPLSFN